MTPLAIAVGHGRTDVANLLASYGARILNPRWDDEKVVFVFLELVLICNLMNIYNMLCSWQLEIALYEACQRRQVELVRLLLDPGATRVMNWPNEVPKQFTFLNAYYLNEYAISSQDGLTPLFAAMKNNDADLQKLLERHGARITDRKNVLLPEYIISSLPKLNIRATNCTGLPIIKACLSGRACTHG